MKLSLIKVSEKYREQICDMLDEWYASGENIVPYAIRRIDYHDFSFYCENLENRNILSEWGVTDSTFFCLDTERDRVVGAVNIRHYLNESLLLDGGHIGDGVRPSERGKGIATEMIRMALEECRRLGIYRVLMVCNKDNVASAKTIQKNGGILENEVEVDGHTEQRYWITLQAEETATVIRHASLEELSDCVEVIRSSFRTVAEEFGITEENAPRFTAFATDEGRLRYHFCVEKRPMYVCLFGGRIVGYYSMSVLNEDETELNNLAVLPEYRHRGIGEALVKDYILKTALIGRKRMKLSLVEENKVLLHWYESFGFTYTESKKYDFFPFTCAYMEKKGTAPRGREPAGTAMNRCIEFIRKMYDDRIRLQEPLSEPARELPKSLLELLSESNGVDELNGKGEDAGVLRAIVFSYDTILRLSSFYGERFGIKGYVFSESEQHILFLIKDDESVWSFNSTSVEEHRFAASLEKFFDMDSDSLYTELSNEERAAEIVRRYGFRFRQIPKEEIRELLEQEREHYRHGSSEYIRLLCGYLFCVGDKGDADLIEKVKFGINHDVQCMVDEEWISLLRAEPTLSVKLARRRSRNEFESYYKQFPSMYGRNQSE